MKYFTIHELTKSPTAIRHGVDNTPNEKVETCLRTLVEQCLDPLREKMGMPLTVNSGYRSPKVNELVGGAKNSQHTLGQAADLQTAGDKFNLKLFQTAKTMDFDQIIWEYGSSNCPDWVHISYVSKEKNRHQILRATKVGGKTTYTKLS